MANRDIDWESISSNDPASDPSILHSAKILYELCKTDNSEELIAMTNRKYRITSQMLLANNYDESISNCEVDVKLARMRNMSSIEAVLEAAVAVAEAEYAIAEAEKAAWDADAAQADADAAQAFAETAIKVLNNSQNNVS